MLKGLIYSSLSHAIVRDLTLDSVLQFPPPSFSYRWQTTHDSSWLQWEQRGKKLHLTEWLLLSNVHEIPAGTIALWYYWRWQIESFFKRMKSAGHYLESWQQELALAIAKRLLVASAAELRAFLVKLSGRQMCRKVTFTHAALLAGLWVFLSMLEIMEAYSPEELDGVKQAVQQVLGEVV